MVGGVVDLAGQGVDLAGGQEQLGRAGDPVVAGELGGERRLQAIELAAALGVVLHGGGQGAAGLGGRAGQGLELGEGGASLDVDLGAAGVALGGEGAGLVAGDVARGEHLGDLAVQLLELDLVGVGFVQGLLPRGTLVVQPLLGDPGTLLDGPEGLGRLAGLDPELLGTRFRLGLTDHFGQAF